jgi:tetratricopeptide (TPR) repeat protein
LGKFFLFPLLWWLTGSPFVAIVILLVILYVADRRFIGLTPSVTRPFQLSRKLAQLKNQLRLSPHDTSLKLEIARTHIEKTQYREAAPLLEEILSKYSDSADASFALGLCYLKTGRLEEGERLMLQAVRLNPRVGYGDPYLRLGEAFADVDPDKAIGYLQQFRAANSSSCEAYYRLGNIYSRLGRVAEARDAFREAEQIYRSLPRYKRRSERKWALLARLRKK